MQDDFAAGVAAAQRQEYATALRYFKAAGRAGMREPLLYYNLGVSYYREGRLDQAESAFVQAVESPRLAALSYYNLGLIARDQGRREQAISRFREAEAAAQTEQMRSLSRLALRQMTGEPPAEETFRPWLIWAEGGLGYDSNAPLATDFVRATDGDGYDQTLSVSAYGQYDFTRLRLHGLASADHYSDMDELDFDMLETGISLPWTEGALSFRPGLNLRHMQFGGESLQDSTVWLLESTAQTGSGYELKFYLEHESIRGADSYQYLDGTRSSLQASAVTPDEHWRLGCEFEFNEREDLFVNTSDGDVEFFSFSPRRLQWQLEYRNSLTDSMDLKVAAGLQDSKYSDADMRADGRLMRREDTRERLVIELAYKHVNDWRSKLEFIYLQRNSNFAEFDYDRGVLTLGLERSFGQ